MTGIQFVPQTGTNQADQDTRKFIRRHVMLGRNQGRARAPKQPTLSGCAVFRKDDGDQATQSLQSMIPRRVGSDLSFLEFADNVELSLMHDTLQLCSTTDEKMFILEPYISFDTTDVVSRCVQSLASDALHLNVMVFGTQAYKAHIFWQTTSEPKTDFDNSILQHYGRALHLLRERLASAERQHLEVSDITIMSVTALAMLALVAGEAENARSHLAGLCRLVRVRKGGVYSFMSKAKQMIEILRCDIVISLATGQVPLFFSNLSNEPIYPLPEPASQLLEHDPIITDSELAKVWDVLAGFCAMINKAAIDQKKVRDQVLLDTIGAVMYRLLKTSYTPDLSDETMRLAMVCFCACALLPLRQVRIPLRWLQLQCRRSINDHVKPRSSLLNPDTLLWYLLVYVIAFSPLSVDESSVVQLWLMEITDQCRRTSWDNVKGIMKRFLWIDFICDRQAQMLIENTLARRAAVVDVFDL